MTTTQREAVTKEMIDRWANDPKGPVALHLKQKLLPVEGANAVIFPPTYAEVGYNIDDVNGKKVATIDSVGSQANRMEPVFAEDPFRSLVPQVEVQYGGARPVTIFEVGHRLGDALFRSTDVAGDVSAAFSSFQVGDSVPLAKLAPTSLVFGVWDSRGSQAKVPRIVQSVVRAWDVYPLKRSAQYEPPIDYSSLEVFSEEEKAKAEGNVKSDLAIRGFVHVPSPGAPGGVIAQGPIERDVTVNLIALRRLPAKTPPEAEKLHRYVLGIALAAATHPIDPFLRQGCMLTPDPASEPAWEAVERNGTRKPLDLRDQRALEYARHAAAAFGVGPSRVVKFQRDLAKRDLEEAGTKKPKAKKGKATADG